MNLHPRYLLGALPDAAWRRLLSRRWFPLLATFQLGREWAYDACRFAGRRDFPVLFDVGAHVGETSLYLHQFFPRGQIHAFEFVPATARQLQENVRRCANVRVHVQALGRAVETLQVPLHAYSKVNSLRFAAKPPPAPEEEILTVPVTTIDAFCAARGIPRIDLLKTDAEGFDLQILEGAAGLIAANKIPFIFSEVTFCDTDEQQRFDPLHRFLTGRGYHLCGFYEAYVHRSHLHFCNVLYLNPAALAAPE
jgi:FkbM family methyltransferase